jgi:hypothetical protein
MFFLIWENLESSCENEFFGFTKILIQKLPNMIYTYTIQYDLWPSLVPSTLHLVTKIKIMYYYFC